MEDQIKVFKQKTALVFTTIEIEIVGFIIPSYVAKFKAGESESKMKDVEIKELGTKKLIEKISKFLDCQIDERYYIIK